MGSYESIKKKAVGMCEHTHITSPSITWRNWCLARTGGMRFKCFFAGPKGETGGECWLEERWTVLAANEKTTHVDRDYKCSAKMFSWVGPL